MPDGLRGGRRRRSDPNRRSGQICGRRPYASRLGDLDAPMLGRVRETFTEMFPLCHTRQSAIIIHYERGDFKQPSRISRCLAAGLVAEHKKSGGPVAPEADGGIRHDTTRIDVDADAFSSSGRRRRRAGRLPS
jgi:hypothetical protein